MIFHFIHSIPLFYLRQQGNKLNKDRKTVQKYTKKQNIQKKQSGHTCTFTRQQATLSKPGIYLECSGWGCNGKAGGLRDGNPPAGSRGRAPAGVWGETGTM